jgi:hypothetical protein
MLVFFPIVMNNEHSFSRELQSIAQESKKDNGNLNVSFISISQFPPL